MYKTNTGKRFTLLVVVVLAVAIFAIPASAYMAPYRVVVFTDKQVYLDFGYDLTTQAYTQSDNTKGSFNQRPTVFASLMDSDGNIVKGLTGTNFSATLKDIARWNHDGVELNSYPFYKVIPTNGLYYNSNSFTFADADGDGIFNATNDVTDLNQLGSPPPVTDQVNISINVTIRYLGVNYTKNVSVIFGTGGCYHPSKAITSAHAKSAHDDVPCTACHWGYQYALGVHGPNNSVMVDDPARYIGIPAWSSIYTYDYKLGIIKTGGNQTTWDNSNASFCMTCHGGPMNANILDLGVGAAPSSDQNADGLNDNNRPSCSWYRGPLGNNTAYPVCHGPQSGNNGSTKIMQAQLFTTDWTGWSQTPGQSKSHNHSATTKGVPCELCHAGGGAPGTGTGGMHQVAGLPNRTTDYSNINEQCQICHNITRGWLNITSNGGTAVNHSNTKTQCSNCHIDNNKLDSHLVPVGAFGGKYCLNCHNITGNAPINMKVDPAIVNVSNQNYIHYALNKISDATNSSRICWGCHTNDSYVINGRVNSTSLPVSVHPTGYDTPRNCTACHYNSSVYNFSAPQNARHTWYAEDMKTPAVTSCPDCHAEDEMLNKWADGVYPPKNDSEASSHYSLNRTSFFNSLGEDYCGYCHQNESTVMGPFANEANEVRSDHASQVTTPGCGDTICHDEGKLHEDTLVVPVFTEANIDSTCLNCHSSTEYKAHNGTITCWDCHMGNVSNTNPTWIHPIQFIQYNGNFTGAKLTGATCYDCHKSTNVDATTQNLSGKTAPKVNSQAHSNAPNNGTIWGQYWDYTPTTYEFASLIVGSGDINPAYPFSNIRNPSNDYMELIENQTGSANDAVSFPYNKAEREIQGPPVPNWTSSTSITSGSPTITAVQDATTGNAAGSLKASLTATAASGGTASWNYSFYYKPDTYNYSTTNITADYNITVESALTQNVYLRLVKPSGTVVTLASASSSTNTGWLKLTNGSFGTALNEDGSVTPYKIQLYTVFSGTGSKQASKTDTVRYDNILISFQEKVWNRYDIVINTTGVHVNGSSKVGMSYQAHMENTTLYIFNKTSASYEVLDYLDKGVFFDYVKDINSTHHINSSNGVTGNVSLRFVDTNQGDTDAISDKFHIRYLYIYTDSGLQYPCEQCHSPNKHYINPTLGSPSKFSAGNNVGQPISSSSTWCQQCHWDGAANYSEMIQEYTVDRSPPENVPPEITGNATYAPTGVVGYYDHTGFDMDDASCFGCHGAAGDTTTTEFIHNVQIGTASGGANCSECHNVGGSKNNVDFANMENGAHANLNNLAQYTGGNATNRKCWACHGTMANGDADETDQPTEHNTSFYKNPRTCPDCHDNTDSNTNFSAPQVVEHIPSATDIPTPDYCSLCHNNSLTSITESDGFGVNSAINATSSHYLKDANVNLMTTSVHSDDCTWCHFTNSANASWGTPVDPRDGFGSLHNGKVNNDCYNCHVDSKSMTAKTFHDAELNPGAGSGPNCMSCHDTSISGTDKGHIDFDVYNNSIHGSMNTNDSITDPNEACWACHGDGTSEGHNSTRYKSPYICQDCHVSGGSRYSWATSLSTTPALTVGEHYTGGTDISASSNANTTYSCLACHESTGEMLLPNNDIDANLTSWSGGGDGYGSEIGNSTSPYHYGKKRTDLTPDTDSYCNYCHSNSSAASIWAWEDSAHNTSITEHTTNTSANITNTTTLNCGDCHSTGRIHNSTLIKPVQSAWTSGKDDYCSPCHTPAGNANKKVYDQWHDPNNSSDNITSCNYCHDSGSLGNTVSSNAFGVHSDNLTFPTGATSCVGCHNASSTYVKSKQILTHFPGASNDKANTSLSGRTCEICHGISGQSMHASGLVKKPNYGCEDCHVSTASGPFWANQSFNTYIDATSHDNTSSANVTDCNWCHNNSEAPEPFHFTQWANGSIENPGWGGWSAGTPVNCTDCHDSINNNKNPFYAPAKTHPGTGNDTDDCYGCHTSVASYADAPLAVHSVVSAPGNANCTMCHDTGGAASKEVDVYAMNKSDSIHLNLNSGATVTNATAPYAADSKRCWACHGDGTDKNEHDQARYKNPYQCEDCHTTSGSKSGIYPTFNVTEHSISGTDIKTPNAGLCTDCHNKSGMVKPNGDSEVSSINASVGHYGKKRIPDGNDFPIADTIAYCNECHNNGSTVFPFIDIANKTIANHSLNYPSLNPSCLDSGCHSTGRIHNSTLEMPALALPNSTYCTGSCHGAGGSASINNLERHNSSSPSSPDCTQCHLNSGKNIHPVQYLNQDGSTWDNTNSSAVNCTTCHQGTPPTGFETSPIIPAPMNHSTNNYSGGLWGSYWDNTSQQDSCRYCHGNISYHNSSGLGYVLSVKGTNTVRMGFSGTWCSNCHYNGAPEYSVSAFTPAPPEITTSTSPNDPDVTWYNHSSDVSSGYTDAKCKDCHNNNLNAGATSLNFSHNLAPGGGGPNCMSCHDSGKGNAMVDITAIGSSMHWNLKNASASDTTGEPANRICWACHQSDGTQPDGHPDKISNPYNCTDCHMNASRPAYVSGAIQVDNHFKSGNNITALTGSGTDDASCIGCHIKPEMTISYTEPDATWNDNSLTSHYGRNRTDLRAMSSDDYCNYCHSNGSSAYDYDNSHNKAITEHTTNTSADVTNITTLNCIDCHTTDNTAAWIHNSTLMTPSANAWTSGKQDYCASCHMAGDGGSLLKVSNEFHNTTGSITDCGFCHNSDAMKAGNAYMNIHSDNLTAGGNTTYNNCYNCHQDGFASRVITEHTNDTGANITNTSMTCDKSGCHETSQTHSSSLVKPSSSAWTAGGNDYCAPCHNSSDSANNATKKIYNTGHNPAGKTGDNITSCGNCHNSSTPGYVPSSFRLHDVSMTKNPVEAGASTCQGCHNTTTAYVGSGKQVLSHMPNSSQYRGNTTASGYTCEYCHNMTGKPSMHSQGMTRSNGTCDSCHYNNTSPFKSLTKNITQLSGGMVNHTYDGRDANTCNTTMCHNASGRVKFHLSEYASGDIGDPQDSGGIKTFVNRDDPGDANDRGVLVDCIDCHETYNDTAPFFAPSVEANNTGENKQEHLGKGYSLNNCYVCHTYNDDVNQPITMHNVSIEPLSGGPACRKCHDIGATDSGKAPDNMLVNFTAFSNYSVHRNLVNSTAWGGSGVFELIDTACWVCHQSDGTQPERHPDKKDENYMAYVCDECHAVGGNVSTYQPAIYMNATKVYKHRPGAVFVGNKVFSNNVRCSECHENSLVANLNISGYSANVYANDTNASHYAMIDDLPNSTDMYGCEQCHKVGSGSSTYGYLYGNARNVPANHNVMGSLPQPCERSCHNSNSAAINLHNSSMGIYVGSQTCFSTGCHFVPSPGGKGGRPR